jgi:hypothetical protein
LEGQYNLLDSIDKSLNKRKSTTKGSFMNKHYVQTTANNRDDVEEYFGNQVSDLTWKDNNNFHNEENLFPSSNILNESMKSLNSVLNANGVLKDA